MISRYLTIFFFSLITEAITSLAEGADTGEVEEVLYKDANTVQKFMRTEEFKAIVGGCACFWGSILGMGLCYGIVVLLKRSFEPQEIAKEED